MKYVFREELETYNTYFNPNIFYTYSNQFIANSRILNPHIKGFKIAGISEYDYVIRCIPEKDLHYFKPDKFLKIVMN